MLIDEPTNLLDLLMPFSGLPITLKLLVVREWRPHSSHHIMLPYEVPATTCGSPRWQRVDPFTAAILFIRRVERDRQAAVMDERHQNTLQKELNWLAPWRSASHVVLCLD